MLFIKKLTSNLIFSSEIVNVPSSVKHSATVVFMHGLGDSGHGWSI